MPLKSGWVENTSRNSGQGLFVRFCGYEKCHPDYRYGPAVRPNHLLHFILSGEGKFYKNNRTYEIHAGMAFMIFPGEVTTYAADMKKPWSYFWVGFSGEEASKILDDIGITAENPVFQCENPDVAVHMNRLLSLVQESRVNPYALTGTLYLLFSLFAETNLRARKPRPSDLYVGKAIPYIQENFGYDITVGDVAKYVGVDRSHLYKVFIEKLSMSVSAYILQYRLDIASGLLRETGLAIGQIACSCGFRDPDHFSKMFKAKYLESPGRYRNTHTIS